MTVVRFTIRLGKDAIFLLCFLLGKAADFYLVGIWRDTIFNWMKLLRLRPGKYVHAGLESKIAVYIYMTPDLSNRNHLIITSCTWSCGFHDHFM